MKGDIRSWIVSNTLGGSGKARGLRGCGGIRLGGEMAANLTGEGGKTG